MLELSTSLLSVDSVQRLVRCAALLFSANTCSQLVLGQACVVRTVLLASPPAIAFASRSAFVEASYLLRHDCGL